MNEETERRQHYLDKCLESLSPVEALEAAVAMETFVTTGPDIKLLPAPKPAPRPRKKAAAKKPPAPKTKTKAAASGRRVWTPGMVLHLKTMWAADETPAAIAARLELTRQQVSTKANILGLPARRHLWGKKSKPAASVPAGPEPAKEQDPPEPAEDPGTVGVIDSIPPGTKPVSPETVANFLRSRDIVIVKDIDSVDTPRWKVNGKGLMDKHDLLGYANRLRLDMDLPHFFYGPLGS